MQKANKVSIWLAKIAMNQARDFLEQRQPYIFTDNIEQFKTPMDNVENIVVLREQAEVLKGIVRKLSPRNQLLYYLKFVEEKSDSEIAGILEVPQGTVKSRISRLRQAIKVAIDRKYKRNANSGVCPQRSAHYGFKTIKGFARSGSYARVGSRRL